MNQVNVLERPARSQFLKKLHRLLEHPTDPSSLRWTSETTFEIAIEDSLAIAALRPEFEFRSLGSFVRQLSYYNFKRLSDRRRSSERGTAKKGFIRFTHQSGYFTRGDASQISRITRRPRTNRPRRPSAASFASNMSAGSEDREGSYPAVAWAAQDSQTPFFNGDSLESASSSSTSGPFQGFTPVPGDQPTPDFANKWRNYSPSTAGFTNPARENAVAAAAERQRRASMPVMDYFSNDQQDPHGGSRPIIQTPSSAPPSYVPLPGVSERRPTHRANYSTNSIPTLSRLPELPRSPEHQQAYLAPPPQQQAQPSPQQQQQGGGPQNFRASEYPTPSYDSQQNVFFTSPTFVPPAPRGQTNLPEMPRTGHQNGSFLSGLKFDPSYYGAHANGLPCSSPPPHALPSPSEHGSIENNSPLVSPTHELPPSNVSCVQLPPQSHSPHSYYQHYSSPGPNHVTAHDYAGGVATQAHRPRLQPSNSEPSYFPQQYQQQAPHSFNPAPWSPGITQA